MALNLEQQAIEAIGRSKHLLLITRTAHSVDDLCSVLALAFWLKHQNKSFDIVIPDFENKLYPPYLPKSAEIATRLGSLRSLKITLNVKETPLSELSYDVRDGALDITVVPKHGAWKPQDVGFMSGDARYDLVIAVGAPDRHSLEPIFKHELNTLQEIITINIDSSPANEQWGTINLVNPTRSSACESLYTLFEAWNPQQLTADIATALLAGMIAATKGFRTPHLSGKTLERSSALLEKGARRQEIVQTLWRTHSVTALQLWGRALARLEQDQTTGLAWTFITDTDLLELKADTNALDGLLRELLSYTPNTKAILLLQQRGSLWQADLHAHAPYSAIEVSKDFLPTGNQEQARFVTDLAHGSLAEQKAQTLNSIKKYLVS